MKEGLFKVIDKKWGKEEWLSLNDKYCFKKITINAGHRTSLQYHKYKMETNHLLSGKAKVTLEDKEGNLYTKEINEGFVVHLMPGDVHRFEALTDIVLFEASTIEVSDVVRLDDDYDRTGTSDP